MMELAGRLKLDKQKAIVILIFFAAFVYADVSFILGGQLRNVSAVGKKAAAMKNDLENLKKELAAAQKTAAAAKPAKERVLVSEREESTLQQSISAAAKNNSVKVMQISTNKEVKRVSSGKAGAKPAAPSVGDKGTPTTIKLDLIASYHNLGSFISEIENGKIVVTVEDLKITRDSNNPSKQKVVMELRTIVKK
jgi:Tfp pilus assembly protein PilO